MHSDKNKIYIYIEQRINQTIHKLSCLFGVPVVEAVEI
jgi:hypothetical protein